MKTTIILISGLLLLISAIPDNNMEMDQRNLSIKDSISIFCSPDLYNLTSEWADGFCNLNPDVKIIVKNVSQSYRNEKLDVPKTLGFISSEYSEMYDESGWNVVVGRDVIVPIFNSENPFLNEICQKGISLEELALIIKNPEMRNWGDILKSGQNLPFNFYMIDDEPMISGMSKLLNINQTEINGIKVENGKALISSVQKDPTSIGICKMINILDFSNQTLDENIKLLPVDRNGNGEIDYMERIYDDMNVFSRGVWIGKYPKVLFNNIYSVSPLKPTNKVEVAFLKWILTDGQQFLNMYGYSDLVLSERQSKVELISENKIDIIESNNIYAISKTVVVSLVLFVVLVFIAMKAVRYIRNRKGDIPETSSLAAHVLDEDFADIPLGLYYDKTHTWAFMEKDGLVRIGIDDFLQHITGPLTRVKMKNTGEKIKKGKQVLSIIQNGKQLNLYAPVSGTIKEQNKELNTNSSIINTSPYCDGWIYIIEPANWLKEIQFLIMGTKYKDWLKGEISRLKEFLTASGKQDSVKYVPVLQDGGELREGILADLGPEVWEDFQTNFIDLSA